ncbi:MAG: T9SS type A sorting domain-containing protein [Bacteroidetes bacterium]|nr:T9SS type A sorting domain-containing protein [Bacteroidota bacterium]
MQQFNAFIDAQNIPVDEAVIFGGDMNVDKHTNKLNEYNNMLTIFNASEPAYIGHVNSWDKYANHYIGLDSEEPEYLDYVLADDDYLIPYEQSNTVWVLRSNHNDMWNIHDLSDHFGIHGRFVYCIRETTTVDAGWSFISSSVIPDDPDMLSVLQGFENDIIILKNGAGDVVIPSIGLNGVGDWDVTAGYQVKSSNSVELEMECTPVDPSKTPIFLTEGWSMVAYLRNSPMDVSIAMASVSSDVIVMKNEIGHIFLPAFGINDIGDMNPGEGYKIKMSNTNTLTYPANSLRNMESSNLPQSVAAHYAISHQTIENATVVIPSGSVKALQEGDEIGIFNSVGKIAGSGVYEGNHLALTVWGVDDPEPARNTMQSGEHMMLKLWRPSLQREFDMTVTYTSGASEYKNDGLSIVGHGSVTELENEATPPYTSAALYLYPNPADNAIHMEVVLPEASEIEISLYDLMGRAAAAPELYDLKEGTSVLNMDISNLPSGRYFYRVRSKDALMNGGFIKMR